MKYILLVLLTFSFCFACGGPAINSASTKKPEPTAAPTAVIPKDGNYSAQGTVIKVDEKQGTVELSHGDIPGLMPPMQMVFNVRNKSQLSSIKAGDKVDFVLEYKHPAETIVDIKKAP